MGLGKRNVTGLCWQDVDLVKRHAFVHAMQSKSKKAIPVPLNSEVISVIRRQMCKHIKFVLTYKGQPIEQCNTKGVAESIEASRNRKFLLA